MTTKKHIEQKIEFYKTQLKQIDKPSIFHGKKFSTAKFAEFQIRLEELESILKHIEQPVFYQFFNRLVNFFKFRQMTKNLHKQINKNHENFSTKNR